MISNWKEYYTNGKIKATWNCENYRPNSFTDSNDRKTIKGYTCIKQGKWVDYYENGQISWERNYFHGNKTGLESKYYANGKIQYIGKNDHKIIRIANI